MTNNKQQTHICVFEKSKTSNSNEAKCKYCNIVRYTIDVKFNNETYGEDNHSENLEQWAWDNPCLSRSDVYNLFEEVFKTKIQNKLRKLAKDKSELLQKSI